MKADNIPTLERLQHQHIFDLIGVMARFRSGPQNSEATKMAGSATYKQSKIG